MIANSLLATVSSLQILPLQLVFVTVRKTSKGGVKLPSKNNGRPSWENVNRHGTKANFASPISHRDRFHDENKHADKDSSFFFGIEKSNPSLHLHACCHSVCSKAGFFYRVETSHLNGVFCICAHSSLTTSRASTPCPLEACIVTARNLCATTSTPHAPLKLSGSS